MASHLPVQTRWLQNQAGCKFSCKEVGGATATLLLLWEPQKDRRKGAAAIPASEVPWQEGLCPSQR